MTSGRFEALRSSLPQLSQIDGPYSIVGGTVRDSVLERESRDVDLVVRDLGAARRFAERLGLRVIPIGREVETLRVTGEGHVWDFARIQGDTLAADLARRDFTINAMALTSEGEFLDPFDGLTDCESGTVRMVSERNFDEDPLRVLRAVRFSATLRFSIDDQTLEACRSRAESVTSAADERIGYELRAMILEGEPLLMVEGLKRTGLDRTLFGFELEAIDPAPEDGVVMIASNLVDRSSDEQLRVVERCRPGRTRLGLIMGALRLLEVVSLEAGSDRFEIHRAGEETARLAAEVASIRGKEHVASTIERTLDQSGFFETKPLLDGRELAEISGVEPGPRLGELVDRLMIEQLEGRLENREQALEWARGL